MVVEGSASCNGTDQLMVAKEVDSDVNDYAFSKVFSF